METIGLIAAMNQESGALLRLVKGWKRYPIGPFRGFRFQSLNRAIVLITTGWGKKRAAEATRVLLAKANPQILVSFGIAGAVHPDLQIGDVVVSTMSWLLENGQLGRSRPLSRLSESAWNAAALALQVYKANLIIGTAITTHGAQVILEESTDMPHPILEMETQGIAQVAAEKGIPLASIRSISDGPQAPIPIDLEAAMDKNDNLMFGKLMMMALRNPKVILQSGRMMKNSGIASDHAARALLAVLNQPRPILLA